MILFPTTINIIEKKDNSAKFEIKTLYPGYGVTIGNALRRVLFSSLPGAAITQVKIKGVSHEFSTIPGVLDDVISILLNLKQLRFKMHNDEPQKATLIVKKEKQIKGSDFEMSSDMELVNQDANITTITDKKTELEIEILVERGLGYETKEKRQKEKAKVGELFVDAIFTPVRKVNFVVENVRKGERTDYDLLKIEIETDGTITPEQAIFASADILSKHFALIIDNFEEDKKDKVVKKANKKEKKGDKQSAKVTAGEPAVAPASAKAMAGEKASVDEEKLEDLKISARTLKILLKNKIKTIKQISKKSAQDILDLDGMGEGALKEIKKALKKIDIELK